MEISGCWRTARDLRGTLCPGYWDLVSQRCSAMVLLEPNMGVKEMGHSLFGFVNRLEDSLALIVS